MTYKSVLSSFIIFATASGVAADHHETIFGFDAESSANQRALETDYDSLIDPADMDRWMQYLTSQPHYVGAPFTREAAEYIAAEFESWGYDVEIERFDILVPMPVERQVVMVEPTRFEALLEEPEVEGDVSSGWEDALPTFNAFSADGDVTAEVVFVNQGLPADYEDLERMGIDVEGKLVIVKYGGSWRGIKQKLAAEHGAAGVLMYSDPADDGYHAGDVYPEGGWRNEYSVQRGSVLDLPKRPSDPLTPGYGATPDAPRIDREDADNLIDLMIMPISYADARPILEALEGPVAPARWTGGLPITYHVGPGPAEVHLKLEFDWDLRPAYNVIARMEGAEQPDRWIMRGNHHDGWGNAAADPTSGLVAMMAEAKAIATLAANGQPPARSIMYAAWDSEEPGILGSSEWVEEHADFLSENLVTYINTDGTTRGFLYAAGSHSLETMMSEITRDVRDPETGDTLYERQRANLVLNGSGPMQEAAEEGDFRLSALGSGSDYTAFIDHIGVASLHMGFAGESEGTQYHSVYDSYEHYTRFGDPGFVYTATLAKTVGRATLRLANADRLPFAPKRQVDTIARYVEEVKELAKTTREDIRDHNRRVEEGLYRAAADPRDPYIPPEAKPEAPFLNFAPLENALADIQDAATDYEEALAAVDRDAVDEATLAALNDRLYKLERTFVDETGLPRREWFRHLLYAPGFYTGYGVKTLPGVREAIEEEYWDEAGMEIETLAVHLGNFATALREAASLLEN